MLCIDVLATTDLKCVKENRWLVLKKCNVHGRLSLCCVTKNRQKIQFNFVSIVQYFNIVVSMGFKNGNYIINMKS